MSVIAAVPVKDFATAKLRLRGGLDAEGCAALARAMASDVLHAVAGARTVARCVVVGGQDARRLAADHSCGYCSDSGCDTLSAAIARAAQHCADAGAETLLVLPADLPTLRAADLNQLLHRHRGGLSLCPADADGGTNALVVTPPDAIEFRYGPDSARRHLKAAEQAGLQVRCVTLPAFARDVDRLEDLHRLACLPVGHNTRAWLERDATTHANAVAASQ